MTVVAEKIQENAAEFERKLPPGWRWVRLGDVCESCTGTYDPSSCPNQIFSYVDIGSVDNKQKRITEPKQLLGKNAPSRARQRICKGDILVSTTRPNLNAVASVPAELDGQVCSTGFCVLRPHSDLDATFLFLNVQSSEFIESLSDLVKGALYPAVTDRQVLAQLIPLPPLAEQKRIAGILLEKMEQVKRARQALEEQLQAATALPAAYLREVFNSPQAQCWPRKRLGEVLRLRKEIIHPHDKPKGPAVFVGLEHIEPNSGRRAGSVEVEMSKLTGRKPQFQKGDIVYGYLRPYLNKIWIADFDGLCSVDQFAFKVDSQLALTGFVAWFMRSPVYLERSRINTTTGQLPRIGTGEVAGVEFGCPSLDVQRKVLNAVDSEIGEIEKLRHDLESQLAALDHLPAALLRQAFAGEL